MACPRLFWILRRSGDVFSNPEDGVRKTFEPNVHCQAGAWERALPFSMEDDGPRTARIAEAQRRRLGRLPDERQS